MKSKSEVAQSSVLGHNLKNDRIISVYLQGGLLNIIVNQVYATDTGEAEVDQFCEAL